MGTNGLMYFGKMKAQPDDGISNDDVQFGLQLIGFNPIHAVRLVEFNNLMTTSKGKEIINNRWKAAGISDVLERGLTKIP